MGGRDTIDSIAETGIKSWLDAEKHCGTTSIYFQTRTRGFSPFRLVVILAHRVDNFGVVFFVGQSVTA
ncbi:hypothetical protein CEXT_265381 [Caerostris extrusa]|uniref:Uncharacterized protein n=1 Tax=Caerostris extrusa TaxID=172846 RepID=A0AAV4V4I4_CAEEX|nr:hypothetical protein CEXT_265381 [Caerostris extrusa]